VISVEGCSNVNSVLFLAFFSASVSSADRKGDKKAAMWSAVNRSTLNDSRMLPLFRPVAKPSTGVAALPPPPPLPPSTDGAFSAAFRAAALPPPKGVDRETHAGKPRPPGEEKSLASESVTDPMDSSVRPSLLYRHASMHSSSWARAVNE